MALDRNASLNAWIGETYAAQHETLLYRVSHALWGAIENANDTVIDQHSQEWFDIAYDSIAFTCAFTEDADVRAWFEQRGYTW